MNNLETNVLPSLNESIIVHYGCSEFNNPVHKVFWIGAINHTSKKEYFFSNGEEVSIIDKFNEFILANKNKTFIHWSMNSPKFGFQAIQNRYLELTNRTIHLSPLNEIDLSEYLKTKYGIDYIDRVGGRLDNLATLNSFSGKKSQIEVINRNDASDRLELIFSIVQAELQGKLKIASFQELNIKDSFKPELNNTNETEAEDELIESKLSKKIKTHFTFLLGNCPRKGRPILTNEDDFNKLIEWTTHFYENNFEVPKISEPIKFVNTNKYITQLAFQILFVELRKSDFHSQRTYAKTIFNLWESSFLDYKSDNENNFWKVKKKNADGIDYDTEVKKLMLID